MKMKNIDFKKSKRIMITYAWGFGNIGDAAITPGLLNLLYQKFPDYKMTVITEQEHGIIARYLKGDFPDCEVIRGNAFSNAYNSAIEKANKEFRGHLPSLDRFNINYLFETFAQRCIDYIKCSQPKFMDALLATRLMIYNSGMVLVYGKGTVSGTDFWGRTLRRSLPLVIARKLRIPYGIYAHSFDSFGEQDKGGQIYFKKILEDAAFVFCRESDSLNYLKKLKIKPPVIMFVPDSTFSFKKSDDKWAELFMKKHNLLSRKFMVVIPRTWLGDNVVSDAVGEKRSKGHQEKLREIIEKWVRRTGMKVLISTEVKNELPNAKHFVYDPLPEDIKCKCVMMNKFWTPDQAVGLYRHARVLITMELHSFLLAVPQGILVIVLTFRESGRKIWMLKDFHLEDYMFDIDSASVEEINQRIYQIYENYERISSKIREEIIPPLRISEEKAMEVIRKVLK